MGVIERDRQTHPIPSRAVELIVPGHCIQRQTDREAACVGWATACLKHAAQQIVGVSYSMSQGIFIRSGRAIVFVVNGADGY